MRKLTLACSIMMMVAGNLFADSNSDTEAPTYVVNRTETAPVIDGVVSPGEWDAAAPAAADWVNLRLNTPDTHNLRFQATWDDTHLYIVTMSDYDNLPEGPVLAEDDFEFELEDAPNNPNWNGNAGSYNANFFIDPNTDGERTWDGTAVPNNQVDGYQIAWDVAQGFSARRPTPGNDDQPLRDPLDADGNQVNDYYGGLFLEAHANSPWGNQGLWELDNEGINLNYRDDSIEGFQYAQNGSNTDVNGTGSPGAVWEVAIAFAQLNATNPNRLVTEAEADSRGPALVVDDREFLIVMEPDPDFPEEMIEVEIDNPDFNVEAPNVGQIPGIAAFIGNAGEPDLRFSDPESGVFIDNGLYAADGPNAGDIWGFESSVITNHTENFIPSWSEPLTDDGTRGSSIAPWGVVGHGRLQFAGASAGCVVSEGLVGDLDGDGEVGFSDFLVLSGNFGGVDLAAAEGDIDCDGEVAFADFLALSGNFGATAAASVPEPSSAMLLVFGLVGLMARRRR